MSHALLKHFNQIFHLTKVLEKLLTVDTQHILILTWKASDVIIISFLACFLSYLPWNCLCNQAMPKATAMMLYYVHRPLPLTQCSAQNGHSTLLLVMSVNTY